MRKAEIFTTAHKLTKRIVNAVGNYSIAFSISLKHVYAMVKMGVRQATDKAIASWVKFLVKIETVEDTVKSNVPDWILRKNLSENEYYAVTSECIGQEIIRETEKAVLVKFDTEYGFVTTWCPKSVLA